MEDEIKQEKTTSSPSTTNNSPGNEEINNTQSEKIKALQTFDKLMDLAQKRNFPAEGIEKIQKAFDLAFTAHACAKRQSGELYIFHPLEVARIALDNFGLDHVAVTAAILHDVVEDTSYDLQYIEDNFGPEVAKIVDGLTKVPDVQDDEHEATRQSETMKKIILSLKFDIRVILVKLADRLHNMRTIGALNSEKQVKIASETNELYAGLAQRLGFYDVSEELRDLCMKHLGSYEYNNLSGKMLALEPTFNTQVTKFTQTLQPFFEQEGLKVSFFKRNRSIHSLHKIMNDENVKFEDIDTKFDTIFVVETEQEKSKLACWQVYSIISDHYKLIPGSITDWTNNSKANGYEAIHCAFMNNSGIKAQTIIRSTTMDDVARYGIIGRLKHSNDITKETKLDQWMKFIKSWVEQNEDSSIDFVKEFMNNLYDKEVFVYTPKGEVRTLPIGSTVLDFAYAISSTIGNHFLYAVINHHQMAEINTKVKNADTVEIFTSENVHPKDVWLNYVTTSRAKTKINEAEQKRKRSDRIITGETIVKEWAANHYLRFDNTLLDKILKEAEADNAKDFFYDVATEKISMKKFEKNIMYVKIENKSGLHSLFSKHESHDRVEFVNSSDPDYEESRSSNRPVYEYCRHCKPIPGDDVVAINYDRNRFMVHRKHCKKVTQFSALHGNRIKDFDTWPANKLFLTVLLLEGTDRQELISDISKVISHEKYYIKNFNFNAGDNKTFKGIITLNVKNLDALDELIATLSDIKNIDSVKRNDYVEN